MASSENANEGGGTWLIDSGCSNHMAGNKKLFQHLEEASNQTIRLGDGKSLLVHGIGSVVLYSNNGKKNTLTNVQYVPNLAHNLLSVGQLMGSGYSVEFAGGECIIKDATTRAKIARVCITSHRPFPLEVNDVGAANVAHKGEELSTLWHKRYGHLNQKSLKDLSEKQIVSSLSLISSAEPCELCSLGKQTRTEFLSKEARRATKLWN